MPYLLIAVLLLGAGLLALRLLLLDRRLRDLSEAVERRKPFLLDQRGFWPLRSFENLLHSVNRIISDIARKDRTEQSHLDQIRATLGSLREAVLILDDQNFIVLANEALRRLAQNPSELVGHRLETLLRGADFFAYVQGVRRNGGGEMLEVELSLGGEERWFEVTGTRLASWEGGRTGMSLFVLHEITGQKRLERMRKDFVANVSHELRTPVTIIKGFVDTLVEDHRSLGEGERERFLGRIQKNTDRLHQLLEELLALSRLESGATETVRRETLILDALVGEVAENFRSRLGTEQRLELATGAAGVVVEADPIQLMQVLNNLMDNVLRHAKGFRTLQVGTVLEGAVVRCWVQDDGAGIPEKDLPKVFERFYRVDKGRSRDLGGTGLGLSIAKHIVQSHGGVVFAESRQGGLTRVGFQLPVGEAGREKILRFDPTADGARE